MKKILIITIAVLIIGFVFYGIQSATKYFNLNKNSKTDEQIGGASDEIVEGTKITENILHYEDAGQAENTEETELSTSDNQQEQNNNQEIKIKIIKETSGEKPDWVKQAWIGLETPVTKGDYSQKGGQEVISKNFRLVDSYATYVEEALSILKEKNPAAEKWWRENVDLVGVDYIAFDQSVCELIKTADQTRICYVDLRGYQKMV